MHSTVKRLLSVAFASVILAAGLPSAAEVPDTVNVLDWSRLVTDAGTSDENWTPAISAAIDYAVQNGCSTVYIPEGRYPCEGNTAVMEAWEAAPAAIYLPDAPITITGDGEKTVLCKGSSSTNVIAMLRTSYKSTAAVTIKDLKIQGKYNPGSSGGLIDGIVLNASSGTVISNVYIVGMKRHGVYAFCGASHNLIDGLHVDNCTREMLGTGLQFEGAYENTVRNIYLTEIGANGIDFNGWNAGSFYPANDGENASPYNEHEKYYSTGNTITGGYISGSGVMNGGLGGGGFTCNPDDDYYGINLIGKSNGNVISLDYIENVRMSGVNSNAAAVRIMGAEENVVTIGRVTNSSNHAVSLNTGANRNTVTVTEASGIAGSPLAVIDGIYGNNVIINDGRSYEYPQELTQGYDFSDWQQYWQASEGSPVLTPNGNGIMIGAGDRAYSKLTRALEFSLPYVTLKFYYRTNSSKVTIGLNEYPWTALGSAALNTDGALHELSVIIPYTDGNQSIMFSPNNSAVADKDVYLEISGLRIFDNRGRQLSGGNVLCAAVTFSEGREGILKGVQMNLYSNYMQYSPAGQGLKALYNRDGSVVSGAIPATAPGLSLKYEYALSDSLTGLGNIQLQESDSWHLAGSSGGDHTDGTGEWKSETVNLDSLGGSAQWGKPMFAFALSCVTNKAVETGRPYYAYYRNIRIEDAAGNTLYTLFDDSVTKEALCPQVWGTPQNASMELSVIGDTYYRNLTARITGDINSDKSLNAADAVLMRRLLVSRLPDGTYDKTAADISGDGKINIIDLVKIKKIL